MAKAVLGLEEIEGIIREEAAGQGGHVHEFFSDDTRLYARTINTPITEVAPLDAVQAGVAVRVDGTDVWVRPYIFRQVCLNGAIVATSEEAEEFDLTAVGVVEQQERHLRETITACGQVKVLQRETPHFRNLKARSVDRAMMMVTMSQTHHWRRTSAELLDILTQFEKEEPSAWGMMNAITAVARETRDPERKWRLEELGSLAPMLIPDYRRTGFDALDASDFYCEVEEQVRELVHA